MEENQEVNVEIEPIKKALDALGITQDEFEQALNDALDIAEQQKIEDVLPIEETPIILKGKSYPLEEVANIEISDLPEPLSESV